LPRRVAMRWWWRSGPRRLRRRRGRVSWCGCRRRRRCDRWRRFHGRRRGVDRCRRGFDRRGIDRRPDRGRSRRRGFDRCRRDFGRRGWRRRLRRLRRPFGGRGGRSGRGDRLLGQHSVPQKFLGRVHGLLGCTGLSANAGCCRPVSVTDWSAPVAFTPRKLGRAAAAGGLVRRPPARGRARSPLLPRLIVRHVAGEAGQRDSPGRCRTSPWATAANFYASATGSGVVVRFSPQSAAVRHGRRSGRGAVARW